MTSDEFFERHGDMRFDVVFIDGLHTVSAAADDGASPPISRTKEITTRPSKQRVMWTMH